MAESSSWLTDKTWNDKGGKVEAERVWGNWHKEGEPASSGQIPLKTESAVKTNSPLYNITERGLQRFEYYTHFPNTYLEIALRGTINKNHNTAT
jgi:hypothetical protein